MYQMLGHIQNLKNLLGCRIYISTFVNNEGARLYTMTMTKILEKNIHLKLYLINK